MAEAKPSAGAAKASSDNTRRSATFSLLKLFWPVPGALAGAAIGFHVYFRQPGLNADTVAPLFIAALWALGGLLIGIFASSVTAWLVEIGLRRVLGEKPAITAVAILLGLAASSYMLAAPLEARLPALFWPQVQQVPAHQASGIRPSTCSDEPPTEIHARQSWNMECR